MKKMTNYFLMIFVFMLWVSVPLEGAAEPRNIWNGVYILGGVTHMGERTDDSIIYTTADVDETGTAITRLYTVNKTNAVLLRRQITKKIEHPVYDAYQEEVILVEKVNDDLYYAYTFPLTPYSTEMRYTYDLANAKVTKTSIFADLTPHNEP